MTQRVGGWVGEWVGGRLDVPLVRQAPSRPRKDEESENDTKSHHVPSPCVHPGVPSTANHPRAGEDHPVVIQPSGWVGGWMGGWFSWVEEDEAVGMSYCKLGVGWVGGWKIGAVNHPRAGEDHPVDIQPGEVGGWVGEKRRTVQSNRGQRGRQHNRE